ncbi:MAG: FGGY-family carbohydrate kinase [Anaerolineales bacterium]|nr:FGGY-family carbohydrate kinase [Anaerolineales bacterium]
MSQPATAQTYVLAIDLGSGGPKVGLVDDNGVVVASAVERCAIHLLPDGGAEQDPHEWWAAVRQATKRVVAAAGVPPTAITAVSCTSQWAVVVPVDANGEPVMNAIHWLDTRGGPYNRKIAQGFPSIQGYGAYKLYRWITKVGLPPTLSGVDSLGHMLYIKNERPEIYRKTDKFLEPMDYLNLRLTGKCAASQITALPFLMTDNRRATTEYDPWLVQVSGVDPAKLPDLLPNDAVHGTVLPEVAADLGIASGAVVIVASNDNHSAAIGAGAIADGEAVAVLGTSGFLATHLASKKSDLTHLLTSIPSPLPDRYLLLAELGNTGKVLESFLNNLVYGMDPLAVDAVAASALPADRFSLAAELAGQAPPGSEGVLFMPWFNGSLAPSEEPAMRGGFLGLSHKTTRAALVRSVFEGIAMNWRWLLGPSQKLVGRQFDHLRLGGGGALSDFWAQVMADVCGIPIHQLADPRNANVRGAAFLALQRLGLLTFAEIPKLVPIAQVYQPDPARHALYSRQFERFQAAFKANRGVYG